LFFRLTSRISFLAITSRNRGAWLQITYLDRRRRHDRLGIACDGSRHGVPPALSTAFGSIRIAAPAPCMHGRSRSFRPRHRRREFLPRSQDTGMRPVRNGERSCIPAPTKSNSPYPLSSTSSMQTDPVLERRSGPTTSSRARDRAGGDFRAARLGSATIRRATSPKKSLRLRGSSLRRRPSRTPPDHLTFRSRKPPYNCLADVLMRRRTCSRRKYTPYDRPWIAVLLPAPEGALADRS